MKDSDEPRRLFESDDAPAELRTWLDRAHDDVPSDAAVEQLVHAVEQRAAARSTPPAPGRRGSWAARAARHSTKLVVAAVVVGVGAWYVGRGERHGDHEPMRLAPPAASPAEVSLPIPDRDTAEAVSAPVAATRSGPSNGATGTVRPRPANLERPTRGALGGFRGESQTAASVAGQADPIAGTSAAPSSEEVRLLRSARQALGELPARALALTEEHARRFPRGMLAQEREAIAVEALAQLGREGQAKERARSFFSTYPSSPHRSRIERALGRSTGAVTQP
jgi:hypothetical protein